MSKRRILDSRIRTSQTFSSLTYRQRDLWQGLIVMADDQGRLPGVVAFVRSVIWPYDDLLLKDVDDDLKVLEQLGCINRYREVEGEFIQLVNWWKYQQPQWAGPSDYPPPPGWDDRMRYHGQGHQVILFNWDKPGGFVDGYPPPPKPDHPQDDLSGEKSGDLSGEKSGREDVSGKVEQDEDVNEEEEVNQKPSSPGGETGALENSANGNKPKTEFILTMECLEDTFAKERGCSLPDWTHPKAANKRWRTPLAGIYRMCHNDIGRAKRVVQLSVQKMIAGNLTFDAPDQILKTAGSLLADLNSGKIKDSGLNLTEEEKTKIFLSDFKPHLNEGVL